MVTGRCSNLDILQVIYMQTGKQFSNFSRAVQYNYKLLYILIVNLRHF
jgi:hypothetical protein